VRRASGWFTPGPSTLLLALWFRIPGLYHALAANGKLSNCILWINVTHRRRIDPTLCYVRSSKHYMLETHCAQELGRLANFYTGTAIKSHPSILMHTVGARGCCSILHSHQTMRSAHKQRLLVKDIMYTERIGTCVQLFLAEHLG
jgi:hypothetical protein